MKLIIAGSRTIKPTIELIREAIRALKPSNSPPISEIVSGGALGVDSEGEHWASHAGVPVKRFRPDWLTHGLAAGPIRNREMAEYGDALLLIWDGVSSGSASMRREMLIRKKPVYEVIIRRVI